MKGISYLQSPSYAAHPCRLLISPILSFFMIFSGCVVFLYLVLSPIHVHFSFPLMLCCIFIVTISPFQASAIVRDHLRNSMTKRMLRISSGRMWRFLLVSSLLTFFDKSVSESDHTFVDLLAESLGRQGCYALCGKSRKTLERLFPQILLKSLA